MRANIFIILSILFLISCREDNQAPTQIADEVENYETPNVFIKPAFGEVYHLGDNIMIEYEPFHNTETVDLYVEKKGQIRYVLGKGIQATGRHNWQTHSSTLTSVHYQIKIVHPDNDEIYSLSDVFELRPK